jgi:multicomponent Na+:H+ antiporter subunit B
MEALINMVLLTLMALVTIGIIRMKSLFGVVILGGIYSFLMASVMIVLDAVDVAMTEASVGAGISTVLMLSVLYLTKREETPSLHSPAVALALAAVTGAALIYGTIDLPPFGAADTPVHTHVAPRYLEKSIEETSVPNVVTSVLASYRGFDTFGETTVIFTAGLGVLLLLRGRRKRTHSDDKSKADSAEVRDAA